MSSSYVSVQKNHTVYCALFFRHVTKCVVTVLFCALFFRRVTKCVVTLVFCAIFFHQNAWLRFYFALHSFAVWQNAWLRFHFALHLYSTHDVTNCAVTLVLLSFAMWQKYSYFALLNFLLRASWVTFLRHAPCENLCGYYCIFHFILLPWDKFRDCGSTFCSTW